MDLDKTNKLNRRRAFRIYEQVDLFYHKIEWIYIFLFAFLVSYLCVPVARKIALKLNVIDIPEERRVHETPTPLL